MTVEELVTTSIAEGVAVVSLSRPARRNAITGPLLDQLATAVNEVGENPAVEAMVLSGAGNAFCSGLDLAEYNADPPRPWLATARDSLRSAHVALASCEVPIVTALERFAINGGAALALAGDLIVVGQTGWIQVGEIGLGMQAPNNLAWLLARHSPATTLRVVLKGDRIAGPEMLSLGLAHEVVPDNAVLHRSIDLAREIASNPAGSGRMLKASILRVAALDDPGAWFERAAALSTGSAAPPPSPTKDK